MEPCQLYTKMLSYYGKQDWWPGEGFEIAIGAILTQNTSWSNVEKALVNLKEKDLLAPDKILNCPVDDLKDLITPAGFFNQKTQYLRNLCALWIKNPQPSREELLAVKGVGEETADSILLYLLNIPEFVIDAYTIRISTRLGFGTSQKKSDWKFFYENSIPKDAQLYNEYHALFVIHAKRYCKKNNPDCQNCFLQSDCQFGKKRD